MGSSLCRPRKNNCETSSQEEDVGNEVQEDVGDEVQADVGDEVDGMGDVPDGARPREERVTIDVQSHFRLSALEHRWKIKLDTVSSRNKTAWMVERIGDSDFILTTCDGDKGERKCWTVQQSNWRKGNKIFLVPHKSNDPNHVFAIERSEGRGGIDVLLHKKSGKYVTMKDSRRKSARRLQLGKKRHAAEIHIEHI